MALSTIGTAAIADDAVTSAKVDSTTAAFTVADLVVTNGITAGTSINAGTELVGNVSGRILLDASASGTDVGDEFLLNATDASASNDGSKILFEEGTDDPNTVLNSNSTGVGGTLTFENAPTGAGSRVLLLSDIIDVPVASYTIDNTYINSTYDTYEFLCTFEASADGARLRQLFFTTINFEGDAGVVIAGSNTGAESASTGASTYRAFNAEARAEIGAVTSGNGLGEAIHFHMILHNANSPFHNLICSGTGGNITTNGAHGGFSFSTGAATPVTYHPHFCRGMQFIWDSGNIDRGSVLLYGVKK